MAASGSNSASVAQRVGRGIADRRRQAGKTQAEVAEALKVEQQTVSRWENGSRSPSLETLDQLAIILDCTLVDFLRDGSDRVGHQLLVVEEALQGLTEAERILMVKHVQQFAAMLKGQRG